MRKPLNSRTSVRARAWFFGILTVVAIVGGALPLQLSAASTVSYVQGNYATPQSPQSSVQVTFTSAQTAGDLNVVVAGWNDGTALVSSVTDSKGNVYTRAVGPTVVSGKLSQSIYYAKNIVAAPAGSNSVTVSFSRAAVSPDIRILEYSGADLVTPVDVIAANTGSNNNSSSGSATTTYANDLIFGANIVYTSTSGPGSGFTKRLLTSPDGDIAQDQMVSATGSYSSTAPLSSSGSWIMQMVAFRAASGGPTLTSIAVTPANASIVAGTQQQYMATGTYSDGSHQNLTNSATWTSSVTTVATVSSTALATGVAAGTTTIQANYASVNGSTPLTVTPQSTYTITASPSSLSVAQGHQGTSTITTAVRGNFNSAISLSATGAPSGTTVSFNPTTIPAPGSGSSTMTITVGTSTPVGTYPITVTGNGGGVQRTATVTLTVTAPASFTLTASPTTLSVAQGSQGSSTLTTAISGGFNSSISLSAAGLPTGTTASFSPATIPAPGNGSSTMTLTVGSSTTIGSYPVTVTASGGGIQQNAVITLTVTAQSSGTISYVQSNYATPQSPQSSVNVTFNSAQVAGDLNVIAVGWNDSTSTVSSVTDSKGNAYVRAVGPTVVSGYLSQSIYYAKNIASAGAGANVVTVAFSGAAVASDIRILEYSGADTSTPLDVTAAGNGNSSTSSSGTATTTTANDLLFGANMVYTSTSGPGSGFTQRMITSPDGDIAEDQMVAAVGSYSATAPLSSSGVWIMQMAAFRAGGGPSLVSIAVTPANPSIAAGTQQQFTATGTYSDGTHRDLTSSATWTSSTTSVATINSAGLATGVNVGSTTIQASSGSINGSTTLTVTAATPNFTVTASPASLTVAQGSQGSSTITTTISGGFNSSISLSAAGAPSGTTVSFNPATIAAPGSGSSTMTITVGSSTAVGTYSIVVTGNGGGIQRTATISLTVSSTSTFVLPLKNSSNGRYLVDQNGSPFLVMGDAPQSMIGNLSSSQISTYLADREAMGFNSLWVNLLCAAYTYCNANGTTYDGVAPFTSGNSPSTYDISTPNNVYFSRVDSMLNAAATYHLVVFLDPIETGGWLGTLNNAGTTKAYNYGVYLGNRYKSFTNIIWIHGNDFQSWTNGSDNNLVKQVMAGIASVDSNHLQTIELNFDSSYSNQDTALGSLLTLDSAYSYYETYDMVLQSYNSSPTKPTYLVEANYEYENDTGYLPGAAGPYVLREQAYWTMLSGATGQLYGSHYTVAFPSGWQSYLDSPGAQEIQYINKLFDSVAWWNLVPDASHTVVTAGYGTYNGSNLNLTTATYCTTSWITSGSLSMTYCPNAATLTVNMAKFSNQVTAEWYDPSNGTYTAISGSPFPNSGTQRFTTPGNNHDGNPDWVLVLHI